MQAQQRNAACGTAYLCCTQELLHHVQRHCGFLCKALQQDVHRWLQCTAAGGLDDHKEGSQAQGSRGVLVRDQRQQLSIRLIWLPKLQHNTLESKCLQIPQHSYQAIHCLEGLSLLGYMTATS